MFSLEEDKQRVLTRGPWHFDRTLIVPHDPGGIGNIREQPFSHVSFQVQLHNVPLMCMDISSICEIGSKRGKMENIAMDVREDCFSEYMRVRTSIDIIQCLKKILRRWERNSNQVGL